MIKKLSCLLLALMLVLSIGVANAGAVETQGKTIKKVVSIVYDDSGSMKNKNEDWAYASYSLQNFMGLLNYQDELSVVKMSKPTQAISFDLSTNEARNEGIKKVEGWKANGGTPFSAVETAVDWLKYKKSGYADSQSVEFWLVIITDGSFETGYPSDMTSYLDDLKGSMGNSKFEGIFVAIGKKVPKKVKNGWTSVTGNHWITASNSNDIVNAMSEVSGLIIGQGGKCTDVVVTTTPDGKSISFMSSFPLKKFVVYEQDQSVGISSVSANGVNILATADFTAKKPGKKAFASRTIHCEGDGSDYIPAGQITVNFDKKIDTTSNKFKILTDSAVNVDFKVLDKTGKEITSLDNAGLVEGDLVEFAATVTSSIDKSPISLKNWVNEISAQLVVNDQSIAMEYNSIDNTFYGSFKIQSGSNLAYAIVTLPGYFRAKSDVVNLYPIEVIDNPSIAVSDSVIDVPYKYCSEYEEIGAFTYTVSGGAINGICNFEFKNMPKGITVSVNGIYADENGKLSVKIHNDIPADVRFYRNKDYKETEKSTIGINVTSNQYVLQWKKDSITEIVLNPIKRKIVIESVKNKDGENLNLDDFEGKAIYTLSVLADDEYLSAEELETLKMNASEIKGVSLETEVVEYNGKHALRVICNRTSPKLFVKTGDISAEITLTTEYDEISEPTPLAFHIKDSLTKYFIPALIIVLIIVLIGYLPGIKKRLLNKKYHVQVNGEAEAIHVKTITRVFPYATEKGYGSDLFLVATGNKSVVRVMNQFDEDQKVLLDGDIKEPNDEIKLAVGSELKITESNRETVYLYCDSASDDTFDDDFGGFDDTDDLFGGDTVSANFGDGSDDDFFN